MKKYFPSDKALAKHIDHYWILNNAQEVFKDTTEIYGYPGIKPDLIINISGSFTYFYKGKKHFASKSLLSSFINGEVIIDTSHLETLAIVQFKPRALSSLLPFVRNSAKELMSNCICNADEVFGTSVNQLAQYLKNKPADQIALEIDHWLSGFYQADREGFLVEMASELKSQCSPSAIMAKTNYSYSTLERYFKKETGLTPKKYQSLQRYKYAVEEIYSTQNIDWMHYVNKYGYYDQSHFIKEIKRYTTFTPAQLLSIPGLLKFRTPGF